VSRDHYRELTDELNIGYEEEHMKMIETPNVEQRAGFDLIMNHVEKLFMILTPYIMTLERGDPSEGILSMKETR